MPRVLVLLLVFFSAISFAPATIYVPTAKLTGESVYVRIRDDVGSVAAVFNFDHWETSSAKTIYFLIYARPGLDPAGLLAQSSPEIVTDEIPASTLPMPCEPPARTPSDPPGAHAYWYCLNVEDLFGDKPAEVVRSGIIVRLRYKQPLIKGRFYYLPIIPGQTPGDSSWPCQMVIRADQRLVRVTSRDTEFYALDDVVVVHLKDRQIVELR